MGESFLHLRAASATDWATVLFLLCFVLVAVTRSVFEVRFAEFMRLGFSDKYIKVYRDSSNLMSWFNVSMFLLHLIAFAFFVQLVFCHYGFGQKNDWLLYLRVFTFLGVFILSKFLIEKIIAECFHAEEFVEQFNLTKVSYRTYAGLLLVPVDIALFYSDSVPDWVISALIVVILAINCVTYFLSLRSYQNVLFAKFFYFILYLCALEIAPYYFLFYWFTKQ